MKQTISDSNFEVKLEEHFKLYVLLKDKIMFESLLCDNEIEFYSDLNEQPFIDAGIRYFLLDSDRPKIDRILKEAEIIASTETIPFYDYRDQKKIGKLYILMFVVIVGLIIVYAIVRNLMG
jgi:hypothetical protein